MRFGWLLIIAMFWPAGSAMAGDATVLAFGGTCTVVQVNGQSANCADNAQVVYADLGNGIVMFNVPLGDGRVMAFVGDHDSQPSAGTYELDLSRVRLAQGSDSNAVDVTGTCNMDLTPDGSVVHRLTCNAKDANGNAYLLDFVGDGKPVTP